MVGAGSSRKAGLSFPSRRSPSPSSPSGLEFSSSSSGSVVIRISSVSSSLERVTGAGCGSEEGSNISRVLPGLMGGSPMCLLHSGQVALLFSQGSTQSLCRKWKQGSTRQSSSLSNSERQMAQRSSLAASRLRTCTIVCSRSGSSSFPSGPSVCCYWQPKKKEKEASGTHRKVSGKFSDAHNPKMRSSETAKPGVRRLTNCSSRLLLGRLLILPSALLIRGRRRAGHNAVWHDGKSLDELLKGEVVRGTLLLCQPMKHPGTSNCTSQSPQPHPLHAVDGDDDHNRNGPNHDQPDRDEQSAVAAAGRAAFRRAELLIVHFDDHLDALNALRMPKKKNKEIKWVKERSAKCNSNN
eukprot:m.572249 g.572249  ORF g.572249 m.572249 type:complete len:353 (-) comp57864_c0_seq4:644-1702(-)